MSEKTKSKRRLFILVLAVLVLAALVWAALFMPAYEVPRPYSAHQ